MTPNLTKKAFVLISLFVVTINSEKCMRRGFSVQETLPLTSCSESLCPECDYCSDENGENSSISTKVDAQNGVLRVFYKLDLAKNYSDLLIRLQVSDELTGESCKRTDPVFLSTSFKIHSSKKVSLKWEPESSSTSLDAPCCKTLELNFKYIFTGCYYVEIFPHKDSNIHQPIEDCPKMYVTDYVKEPLMLMTPKLSPQYFSDSVQVSMNIRGEPAYLLVTLHSEKIRNIPFQGKKTCDRFSTEYACCYNHMYKTPMGGFECQSKMKSPETNCSVVNSKQGVKEVKCVFSHIKPGNYCISIKFDDERCVAGTTWETNLNGCLWRLRYEAKSSPVTVIEEVRETVELVPSNDLSGYIFAVLSVSIVVLMLLLLVMWKKYSSASLVKPTDRITTLREHLGLVKIEQPSVLLLYPRDSNTFMNAMAQFRKVLRRANCKVYDCWDPSMESEVMKSPHSWIQLHALDKSTRVIIVASQCSLLLERSVLGNSKVEYLYPSPFDDLFMYGIRCLNETTLTDCYEKMFVVRLRGQDDTSEVASLTYINPLTVFSLPLHLEKLILGLLSVDGSHYSIATDFPEVRAFAKAVQENSWFMKENPNYLSSLMHSTNSCPEEELLQFS